MKRKKDTVNPTRVPNHHLVHCNVYDVSVLAKVTRTVRVRARDEEEAARLAVSRTNERTSVLKNWNAILVAAEAGDVREVELD